MRLMATLFILLVTVTPSFAEPESILSRMFSGHPQGNESYDPAERLAYAKQIHKINRLMQIANNEEFTPEDVRVITAFKSTCREAFPDNKAGFGECFMTALLRMIDAEVEAMVIPPPRYDKERQQAEATEQKQQQLYKKLDLRIQKEREILMPQRDAQIDAARNRQDAQLEAARIQAAGMILQGFALRGGPLGSFQMPAPSVPYTPPAYVPALVPRSLPPVSCSTYVVGGVAQTDCY